MSQRNATAKTSSSAARPRVANPVASVFEDLWRLVPAPPAEPSDYKEWLRLFSQAVVSPTRKSIGGSGLIDGVSARACRGASSPSPWTPRSTAPSRSWMAASTSRMRPMSTSSPPCSVRYSSAAFKSRASDRAARRCRTWPGDWRRSHNRRKTSRLRRRRKPRALQGRLAPRPHYPSRRSRRRSRKTVPRKNRSLSARSRGPPG